ncbi:hypothetical protein [Streptomyces sp. NPDC001930]|uniref:hypothetical protein n=1 Tax=Streptomyces sp. NPDC001930 TaxID=3364625 RepID=UPI0036810929
MPLGPRLERRIRRDFPDPGSAAEIRRRLVDLPETMGYDHEFFACERAQAAMVLLAGGSVPAVRAAEELAARDWRDLLVGAGLAHEDWPDRLLEELGPETP